MVFSEEKLDLETMLKGIDGDRLIFDTTDKATQLVDPEDDLYFTTPLFGQRKEEIIETLSQSNIYRKEISTIHEAIHNAAKFGIKHNESANVHVKIYVGKEGYVVSITDEGRGYDEKSAKSQTDAYSEVKDTPLGHLGEHGLGTHAFKKSPYIVSRDQKGNRINLMCLNKMWDSYLKDSR